jgi:hypothetical protein
MLYLSFVCDPHSQWYSSSWKNGASTGSWTLSSSVAVAGPTPVRVVRCFSASVGNWRPAEFAGALWVLKPAEVADLTTEGSFLRIWAGRKGRLVPWVLWLEEGVVSVRLDEGIERCRTNRV